jgi:hypothetical protein
MYPEANSKTSMRMHWEISKNVAFGYRNNEIEIYKQLVYVAIGFRVHYMSLEKPLHMTMLRQCMPNPSSSQVKLLL